MGHIQRDYPIDMIITRSLRYDSGRYWLVIAAFAPHCLHSEKFLHSSEFYGPSIIRENDKNT